MAEMAVSLAIDQLVPLLKKEAKLLKGIHKEFADIKDELESIQAFLKDAEKKCATEEENTNEGVKTWVKRVMESAFRIEDIIDDYVIYVRPQPRDPGWAATLTKIGHLIRTLMPRHRIASEIRDIKSSVLEIKSRRDRYDIQLEPGSSISARSQIYEWHDPRMASLYLEEAEIVGFEAPSDDLIGWLVAERIERTVIAVVGMGGQGKTTLAKKVFDNQRVVTYFDCRAWITVSQSYTADGLLRDMLQKFGKGKKEVLEMDRASLIDGVRNHLQQKRYVVVFDDVWDECFWNVIEFVVVDSKKGSRVLITTRNIDVAMSCKRSSFVQLHELQPLTEEKSFELFCKKAFLLDFNGCCPNDLVDISSKIVKKCKGLPLAIVAIGGLLSCKEKTSLSWERFYQNLSSELERDSHLSNITKIIGFSYDDLPYYLKSCCLYFGMYPEDYEVGSKRLFQQWIAERFIKDEKGKTSEEVAEQYLTELISRSLVQVSSITKGEGRVKGCRVHDLTREMILKKCKDLSFCQYVNGEDEKIASVIVRRQSIAAGFSDCRGSIESSHVRSLFFFTNHDFVKNYVKNIPKTYKLLKILDLDFEAYYGQSFHFPQDLGNLIHLKYLSLRGIGMNDGPLPKSIGKLQNLETLIIEHGGGAIIRMPKETCKLKKLRHLVVRYVCLDEMKDGIRGMTSLQTLKYVNISPYEGGVEVIRQVRKLRQLRDLGFGLTYITREHESAICSLLNEMQHLEKLAITSLYSYPDEVMDLNNSVSSPPGHLCKLYLAMKLLNNKLPEWVQELKSLTKLTLRYTDLAEDAMESLQNNLPNLLYLEMCQNAYSGKCMRFEEGGFQNLKDLQLSFLDNLKSIMIEKGAMRSLNKLTFIHLPELKELPSGIQYLDKLQHLTIIDPTMELKKRIAPNEGEDHWRIHHVPYVKISFIS